jgi:transcriptional regulator with XRE-family HTH domain
VPTLAEVIAANIKRLREAEGISQDQLARRLRLFSLDWTRNNVAYAESGKYEPPVSEVVLVAYAFDVPPRDLLTTASSVVALNDVASISASDARKLLSGHRLGVARRGVALPRRSAKDSDLLKVFRWEAGEEPARSSSLSEIADYLEAIEVSPAKVVQVMEMVGEEAVRHLAGTLGLKDTQVSALALKLWGRSLSQVRDEQAGPGANAMKKAHVSRRLKKEISAAAVEVGWLPAPRTVSSMSPTTIDLSPTSDRSAASTERSEIERVLEEE